MNDDRTDLEPIETGGDDFKVVNTSQIPKLVSVLRITHPCHGYCNHHCV
ncbi:MAG: hypothetical protein VYA84_16940 [Planctomycetota bacterium]|nr:hypothetical protein [Planctomycetota bacterium]